MASPVVKVEVSFDGQPNSSTAGTWTDVTSRVLSLNISRGRSYELGRMDAGTATIQVSNEDGLFDPLNTASAYNSGGKSIVPYRQVRISATYSGTQYWLFTGFVERWTQDYVDPARGVATLTAVDALALLSQVTVPTAITSQYLLPQSVDALTSGQGAIAYYPLGEEQNSLAAGNVSGVSQSNLVKTPTPYLLSGTLEFGDNSSVTTIPGGASTCLIGQPALASGFYTDGYYLTGVSPWKGFKTNGSLVFDVWVNVDAAANNRGIVHFVSNGSSVLTLYIDSSGYPTVRGLDSSGSATSTQLSLDVRGAGWTHLSVFMSMSSNTTSNATVSTTITANGYAGSTANNLTVAYVDTVSDIYVGGYGGRQISQLFAGKLAHLAIWNTNVYASTQYRYLAGLGWALDDSGLRFARVIDNAGFGNLSINYDTGVSLTPDMSYLYGKSAGDALQTISDSENGQFWVDGSGSLVFKNRNDRLLNHLTVNAVFGGNSGEIAYNGTAQTDYDPTYIYNTVQITRNNGANVVATDATSVLNYFSRSFQRTLYISSAKRATVVNASGNGALQTYTTATAHGFKETDYVTVTGANSYNVSNVQIQSVTTNTFVTTGSYIGSFSGTALAQDLSQIDTKYADAESADAANFFLTRYKDPHARVPQFTVFVTPQAAALPAMISLDINSRVQFNRRQLKAPVQTVDGFVERIEHQINAQDGTWFTSLVVSPQISFYGILNNTTYGKLNSTMVLTY